MTKHLIALVRLAGRSYRILILVVKSMERFPLDRFITAIDLFIRLAEAQAPPPEDADAPDAATDDTQHPFSVTNEAIEAGEWMTRKEAWNHLGVVKSTLEEMINTGELDRYHKKGDERKKCPRVWLKRTDVEALYHTYTLRKGKEKKPLLP